jgi:hypothetical protein
VSRESKRVSLIRHWKLARLALRIFRGSRHPPGGCLKATSTKWLLAIIPAIPGNVNFPFQSVNNNPFYLFKPLYFLGCNHISYLGVIYLCWIDAEFSVYYCRKPFECVHKKIEGKGHFNFLNMTKQTGLTPCSIITPVPSRHVHTTGYKDGKGRGGRKQTLLTSD